MQNALIYYPEIVLQSFEINLNTVVYYDIMFQRRKHPVCAILRSS